MIFVAGENLVPILVALLIGFVTGFLIWRRSRRDQEPGTRMLNEDGAMRRPYVENRPAPPPLRVVSAPSDGPRAEPEVLARRNAAASYSATVSGTDDVGDNDVASGAAAAVEDVIDQFIEIDAHPAPQSSAGQSSAGGPASSADNLQLMKGVGPKLASLLGAEGITRFEQIAALSPDDLHRLDAHLGAFRGRLARDRIVEQAAFLAAGDRAGYEREFGRI